MESPPDNRSFSAEAAAQIARSTIPETGLSYALADNAVQPLAIPDPTEYTITHTSRESKSHESLLAAKRLHPHDKMGEPKDSG